MESEEGDQSRRETNGSVVVESSAHFNFNNTDAVAVGVANRHELGLGTGVWLDDLATPLRSEFNQYKPPTDVNQMGQFQSFFQNQEKLLPADKSAYLFMVASLGVVPFCDDKSEPYATYIKQWKKKGRKNHLNFTKNMVAQEILRRDPEAKINPKNKSLAKLADELRSRNLTDAADVKFIRYEEFILRSHVQKAVESDDNRQPSVMLKNDRLRFVECLRDATIKEAYLRTQEIMTRTELDGRNSNVHQLDFYDLISQFFNNPDFVPIIPPLPNLHEDYMEPTTLPFSGKITS